MTNQETKTARALAFWNKTLDTTAEALADDGRLIDMIEQRAGVWSLCAVGALAPWALPECRAWTAAVRAFRATQPRPGCVSHLTLAQFNMSAPPMWHVGVAFESAAEALSMFYSEWMDQRLADADGVDEAHNREQFAMLWLALRCAWGAVQTAARTHQPKQP